MNRIQGMIRVISQSKDSLERVECNYEGIKKGSIYKAHVRHHKDKIESYTEQLEIFGAGSLINWDINGSIIKEGVEIMIKFPLILPEDITEEEIIDRMKLSGYSVISLKALNKTIYGFPRINEFSQSQEK